MWHGDSLVSLPVNYKEHRKSTPTPTVGCSVSPSLFFSHSIFLSPPRVTPLTAAQPSKHPPEAVQSNQALLNIEYDSTHREEGIEVKENMAGGVVVEGTTDVGRVEAPVTVKAYLICAFAAFGGIFFGYDTGKS